MEMISSSEAFILIKAATRHFLEDGILHNHRRENLYCRKLRIIIFSKYCHDRVSDWNLDLSAFLTTTTSYNHYKSLYEQFVPALEFLRDRLELVLHSNYIPNANVFLRLQKAVLSRQLKVPSRFSFIFSPFHSGPLRGSSTALL
jgi:hypothetical protein